MVGILRGLPLLTMTIPKRRRCDLFVLFQVVVPDRCCYHLDLRTNRRASEVTNGHTRRMTTP